ncbi:uncharacterized protein LOC110456379 [Mizuhopecten yessoensis]|uniref:uncharacterized protein LOC110456379 n=1 Tax=Mizuhopecten yessoensis TaxID=6573 RepID=UPI000B45DF22|nr:uncharacterized protein LOC110456379 [Mizuhopecten yessoensis]
MSMVDLPELLKKGQMCLVPKREILLPLTSSKGHHVCTWNSQPRPRRVFVGNSQPRPRRVFVGNSQPRPRRVFVGNSQPRPRRVFVGNSQPRPRRVFVGNSQPCPRRVFVGNFLLSSAILTSGNNFQKIYLMTNFLNLGVISYSTHMKFQGEFTAPVIGEHYDSLMERTLGKIYGQTNNHCWYVR